MNITMSSPALGQAEVDAINEVLRTSYLSIGPRVDAFEQAVSEYVGGADGEAPAYATAVNSGTSGLHLSIIAAGVREGDLVITTPFSFIASSNCILYERAVPVFVDVDPRTGNIDPERVAEVAEDLVNGNGAALRHLPPAVRDSLNGARHGRLRAILPVDAFGQPADMDPILETARRHAVPVIEDSCEAIGARYKDRPAGLLGDAGVFAFYPNKQITTGEGGMAITRHSEWDALFRSLRNQGRDVFDAWLNHTRLGYNYRMDEMSAAMGLAQMGHIEALIEARAQVAGWYNERLANEELVETPFIAPETTRMSWFVYVVRIRRPAERDRVLARLAEEGIPCRPYFTPIHLQPFYRKTFGYGPGDFPVTEALGSVSLALPFSSVMTEAQVDHVCDTLRAIVAEA